MFESSNAYLEITLSCSEECAWQHWLAPGSDSLYAEDLTKIAIQIDGCLHWLEKRALVEVNTCEGIS